MEIEKYSYFYNEYYTFMNLFLKPYHISRANHPNLEKASSSSALNLGKMELAKSIVSVKQVRDNKELTRLQSERNELFRSDKNNVVKIRLIDSSMENIRGKIDKRGQRLREMGQQPIVSQQPQIGRATLSTQDTIVKASSPNSTLLDAMHKQESFDKSKHELLGKGSRGNVYRSGSMVIKVFNEASSDQIFHELNMCNAWLKDSGYTDSQASLYGKNYLRMPYREGEFPSNEQVKTVITDMFGKGFMIGDPRSNNFVLDQKGTIHPIDFGLVFRHSDIDSITSDCAAEIVRDYVKGGYACVPVELKADYASCISQLDSKCYALGSVNVIELRRAGLLNLGCS